MRCLGYMSPDITVLDVAIEQGFALSTNEGYGDKGEAGDNFDEVDNGEF